jgi:hypothetical protein
VQVTFLRPDGSGKANLEEPRWTFGRLSDGAVRLAPVNDVFGLAEGIEDALAASQLSQLSQLPCWSSLGAGRMHNVAIPQGVRELHICADDDQAGRTAVERMVERHSREGRRVVVRLPPAGFKDWGEIVSRPRPEREAA